VSINKKANEIATKAGSCASNGYKQVSSIDKHKNVFNWYKKYSGVPAVPINYFGKKFCGKALEGQ
jgi:uncharacterized protein (DUF2147 family)